tara:strand:+ start:6572 stop:8479 length:1908 start_codon:yes stop_codon:yes gene_type:complete
MDFESSQYNQTIPSKSSIIPSDNQLSYSDGQTIRFEIPQVLAPFIDPRQTYLKYKLQVKNSAGVVCFSKKCGCHSLISELRVYDLNSNLQLETITAYDTLAEKLHYYSENTSVRNKRGITEMLEYTSRYFDGELYDNIPSRNADNSMMYNSYQTGNSATYTNAGRLLGNPPTGGAIANFDGLADSNKCEVATQLYSGLLGRLSTKLTPAMLVNGLRLELTLSEAKRALNLWAGDGIVMETGVATHDSIEGSSFFGIQSCNNAAAAPAAALEFLDLYTEKNAGHNQITCVAGAAAVGGFPNPDSVALGMTAVRNQLVGGMNLLVGKRLWAWTNAAVPLLVDCGTIFSLTCNAGENAGGVVRVRVNMNANSAIGGVALPLVSALTGGAGRLVAGALNAAANGERSNLCFMKSDEFFDTPAEMSIELTDVELVVKTASPPKAYIDKYLKQSQTEEGATFDFMTYSVWRNNTTKEERVVQMNIPALNNRAVSILTLPTQNGQANDIFLDNLATIVDGADNYNFLVNNKSQPTRKTSLKRLSGGAEAPKTEQTALWETEKALVSSRCMVKNLRLQEENLIIGRALAKNGAVYPLVEDGGVQLKVEYKNDIYAPTKNKLFVSYVGGLRRLTVSKNGSFIEQ